MMFVILTSRISSLEAKTSKIFLFHQNSLSSRLRKLASDGCYETLSGGSLLSCDYWFLLTITGALLAVTSLKTKSKHTEPLQKTRSLFPAVGLCYNDIINATVKREFGGNVGKIRVPSSPDYHFLVTVVAAVQSKLHQFALKGLKINSRV